MNKLITGAVLWFAQCYSYLQISGKVRSQTQAQETPSLHLPHTTQTMARLHQMTTPGEPRFEPRWSEALVSALPPPPEWESAQKACTREGGTWRSEQPLQRFWEHSRALERPLDGERKAGASIGVSVALGGRVLVSNPIYLSFSLVLPIYSKSTPWYMPPKTKNIYSHKNLYTNIHSSFIHNSQQVEATQMFTNRWIDK